MMVFVIVAVLCCAFSGSDDTSKTNSSPKRNTASPKRSTLVYYDDSYSECPSCGAPYYDGYCEECGYPDVNQGWLGEEYG